jgi:hypothetical protein
MSVPTITACIALRRTSVGGKHMYQPCGSWAAPHEGAPGWACGHAHQPSHPPREAAGATRTLSAVAEAENQVELDVLQSNEGRRTRGAGGTLVAPWSSMS